MVPRNNSLFVFSLLVLFFSFCQFGNFVVLLFCFFTSPVLRMNRNATVVVVVVVVVVFSATKFLCFFVPGTWYCRQYHMLSCRCCCQLLSALFLMLIFIIIIIGPFSCLFFAVGFIFYGSGSVVCRGSDAFILTQGAYFMCGSVA